MPERCRHDMNDGFKTAPLLLLLLALSTVFLFGNDLLRVRLLSSLRVRQLSDSVTTCNYGLSPIMEMTNGPGQGQSGEAYGAV